MQFGHYYCTSQTMRRIFAQTLRRLKPIIQHYRGVYRAHFLVTSSCYPIRYGTPLPPRAPEFVMAGFALRRSCVPHFHIRVQIECAVSRRLLGGTLYCRGHATRHVVLFLSRNLESSVLS